MPFDLYIIKYGTSTGHLFNNHWALFVHTGTGHVQVQPPNTPTAVGIFIHVKGSLHSGYIYEASRLWNMSCTSTFFRPVFLGTVTNASMVSDIVVTNYMPGDTVPRTPFERSLLRVPPPGPSLVSAQNRTNYNRVTISGCQQWLRAAVQCAVADGHLTIANPAVLEEQ